MSITGFSALLSPVLRSVLGFLLLAITAMLFVSVVGSEQQMLVHADSTLTALKTYGMALLLGIAVIIDIAWFSAVVRQQASEGRDDDAA